MYPAEGYSRRRESVAFDSSPHLILISSHDVYNILLKLKFCSKISSFVYPTFLCLSNQSLACKQLVATVWNKGQRRRSVFS